MPFLRAYAAYFFGIPKEDWLCALLNHIGPEIFEACFTGWALSLRKDAADLIALDGKSLRRSGDSAAGAGPLDLVSAWASTQRLVLAQEPADAPENERAVILEILNRPSTKGALITIGAMVTNPAIASAVTNAGGEDLRAQKANAPAFHAEIFTSFDDAPSGEAPRSRLSTNTMGGSRRAPRASEAMSAGSSPTMNGALSRISPLPEHQDNRHGLGLALRQRHQDRHTR